MDQTTTAPSFPIIHVVEISNGCDLIESISTFAQSHGRGVCILGATGTVTNVSLRLPGSTSESFTLLGEFDIVSLSGCLLPTPTPHDAVNGLSIHVAINGGFGQVAGGSLLGGVVAAGGPPVVMMAVSFSDAVYERVIPNHPSLFDGMIMSQENPLQLPHDYDYCGGNGGGGSDHGGGQPF